MTYYPPKPASATQVGGDHYKALAIQPAEYCYRNNLNSPSSNIVRYATRAGVIGQPPKGGLKGQRQDIEKIIHYGQLWLEWLDSEESSRPHTEAGIGSTPPGPVTPATGEEDRRWSMESGPVLRREPGKRLVD